MVNKQNLVSLADKPEDERRDFARMGGIASGESRREKRKTLDMLEMLLEQKISTEDGRISREQAYMLSVLKKGIATGRVDLLELIAKLRGEMVNKTEMDVSGNIPAVLTEEMIITDDELEEKPKKSAKRTGKR